MTIVTPKAYHAKEALESNGIHCIDHDAASQQDIRPLRIGILNIMPNNKTYEFNILYPLGKSILQIEPIWIKLQTHEYRTSSVAHMSDLYVSFDEAIKEKHLDGLILTGAPVETLPFEEIKYWAEVERILLYARHNIASTLGICWGGMALAKILGIEKINYDMKLFGVYDTLNIGLKHEMTQDFDDVFRCPQSRHAGYDDAVLEAAKEQGVLNLLAYNEETGYTIFESTDQRYFMHLGHPEYNARRLVEESLRDKKLGRKDVGEPVNFDANAPKNLWRGHRNNFFSSWIKFVYLRTKY